MIGTAEIEEMMAEYAETGTGEGREAATLRWPPTLDGPDEPARQTTQPAPGRAVMDVSP